MCAKGRVMGGFLWSRFLWICVTLYSTIFVDDNGCCRELCDESNLVVLRMRLLWMVWQFIPQLLRCCCELCDDSFHCLLLWVVWWWFQIMLLCYDDAVLNCVTIRSIVVVVLLMMMMIVVVVVVVSCVMVDWSQVLWCCWCLLLWIVWWWFIHAALVGGCLFSCCWRTNKAKGVPAQLPKGTAFGLFVEEFQNNLCLFPEEFRNKPFPCWRNVGTSFVCWRNAGTSFVVCWRMQNFVLLILASVEVVSLSGCLHEALMAGQQQHITSVSSASPAACYYAMD